MPRFCLNPIFAWSSIQYLASSDLSVVSLPNKLVKLTSHQHLADVFQCPSVLQISDRGERQTRETLAQT